MNHNNLLNRLVNSAIRNSVVPDGGSHVVPAETLLRAAFVQREDFLQLFSESPVLTHGDWTVEFDAERDRVNFTNPKLKAAAVTEAQSTPVLPAPRRAATPTRPAITEATHREIAARVHRLQEEAVEKGTYLTTAQATFQIYKEMGLPILRQ
jgi:hypothetical protein